MVTRLEQRLVAKDELQPRYQLPLAETIRTNNRKTDRTIISYSRRRIYEQVRGDREFLCVLELQGEDKGA